MRRTTTATDAGRGRPVRCGAAVVAMAAMLALGAGAARADEPSPEADFKAANERLLSGDTAGAIALYQHLESRGVVAADLAYNLGVALAKAERPLEAIVAWERALRLDPAHADARANLETARTALPRRATSDDGETTSATEALEPLVAPIPRDGAAFALVVAVTVLCAALAIRRLGALRGRGTGAVVVVSVLLAVASGLVVAAQEAIARDGRAVVQRSGQLKDGAEARFADIAPISAGERVRILEEEAGWVHVQAQDGVRGWVEAASVLRL